jgi:periplasmic protein TonB
MFEDALMESAHKISSKSRYWSLLSLLLNLTFLIALILWPLLCPLALPKESIAPLMVAPSPPPASPVTASTPRAHIKSEILNTGLNAPSKIPRKIEIARELQEPPRAVKGLEGPTGGKEGVAGPIFEGFATGPAVVKPAEPKQKLSVSSGVMAGNLLEKTLPEYPAIARAARIQGIVVLQATISTSGEIKDLRVLSGPPMLQQAAKDAVRSWHYKPYLLNGTPIEIETTINVVFSLGP